MDGAPVQVVDARGTSCPVPIIECARALRRGGKGHCIEVLADDPGVEHDLPAFCAANGHELLELTVVGGLYRARVRRLR